MGIDFSGSRQSYEKDELIEKNIENLPYPLLKKWIDEAVEAQIAEPYAFSLATCGTDMRPSVRTLLMREVIAQDDEIDLIFYSNYDSQKGRDLAQNPLAQALFFWHTLERQIRLFGRVSKLPDEQSSAYFHSRPKDSQLAAWVSRPQSGVVANRETMEREFAKLSCEFGEYIPKPDFWGGYCLRVEQIEFWQGRANRMHDRILYSKHQGNWMYDRLLP